MEVFKDKYFVFLVSGGRTGTRFFGTMLSRAIEGAFSSHEPDVFTPRRGYGTWTKIRQFGVYQLIIGKLLNKTGLRNLSQNYISGKLNSEQLAQQVKSHREKYYATIDEDLIIESYSGWYGCIDGIRNLYDNYRVVIIARDPRTWVTSIMNWDAIFGERDYVTKLGRRRLDPAMTGDQEYIERWQDMTRFEKVCWTYKGIYGSALAQAGDDPSCTLVRYEDLFNSEDSNNQLIETLDFMTTFPDRDFPYDANVITKAERIHQSRQKKFPAYDDWTHDQKLQLKSICGAIAGRMGYDLS